MQAPSDSPTSTANPRTSLLLALLVALAPIALFWPILSHGFVYDDLPLVANNPLITGFDKLPEQFSSALLDNLEPTERARVGYWRPLTSIALTLGHVLGGGSASAFHALSIAAHAAAVIAAFFLALRLTRSDALAAFVALLFAVHPAQVESVAWISAINSMLFGGLVFLALERFIAWRERGSSGVPIASGVLLFLALLAKEMAVAAIPCAIALDLWRRDGPSGSWKERLAPIARAYGPFGAAFGAYYLARVGVFHGLAAGFDLNVTHLFLPAPRMLLMRFELLGGFLKLLAWPAELSLFRPIQPDLRSTSAAMLPAWLATGAALALFFLARRLGWRIVLGALAFLLAALSPTFVRIESLGMFPLADRYLYLASFGFALAIAWIAWTFLPRALAIGALLAVAGAFTWRSAVHLDFWRDEPTVFARSAELSPRSPYVQWNLGRILFEQAHAGEVNQRQRAELVARAQTQFEKALELADAAQRGDESIFAAVNDFIQTNIGLGWCELERAEYDGYADFQTPLAIFQGVVARYPDNETGHHAVAAALMRLRRYDEAEKALKKALELNPRFASAWHNLGKLHVARGDWPKAIDAFEKALAIRPGEQRDLLALASTLADSKNLERADSVVREAIALAPQSAAPLVVRAKIAAQRARFDEAIADVRRALELDPDDGEALLLKGLLHARVDERAAAEEALTRAAALLPDSFPANYNAASLLLDARNPRPLEALPYLVRAYSVRPEGPSGDAVELALRSLDIQSPELLCELASDDVGRRLDGKASAWLDRALLAKPDHGPSHYLQGVIAERRNDPEAAIAAWKKAAAELPNGFQVRQSLGTLLEQLGRHAEALPYLKQALELGTKANAGAAEAGSALDALRAKLEEVRAKVKG